MPAWGRVLAALLLALLCLARPADALAEEGGAEVHVYLFWSASCPHCLAARPQVQALAAARPWVVLHDLELGADPTHGERYEAMAAELGEEALAVPALFYCGRMEVGWNDGGDSAARLAQALDACRAGATPAPQPPTLRLPGLGEVDAARLSLPVDQRDRRRMLLIGMLFVAVSGLMYFAFMAAWLGLFLVVGGLPWVTAAAGVVALVIGVINVKDFVAFRQGLSLSIPAGGKADIFQRARAILKADRLPAMLAATLFLAVVANFYELLCTAGFPMVYTRLLSLQVPDRTAQYGWLALYNLVYVLPLMAIVLAFVRTMGARRLGEREGRLLKLLSGLMMLGLGLCLVLAPQALGDPRVALGLLGLATGLTGLATWRGR